MSAQDWMEKDFYKELGVEKTASQQEIKKSFRKLARELHPDKNPGNAEAEKRFKAVSEAYDVLSDEAKRKEYDEARALFAGGACRGGRQGAGGFGGGQTFDMSDLFGQGTGGASSGGGFSDLFGGLFGGAGGSAGGSTRTRTYGGPTRGQDVDAEITIGFTDAVEGATLPLRLSGPGACPTCHGTGARPGTTPHTCANCGGSGFVSRNQGAFGFSEPCRECAGTGQVIDSPCPDCGGSGSTTQSRTITVRIPAGVRDGARLRIAGKGTPGKRGGPPGDLYVTVHVGAHELFGRDGDNLTLIVPVAYTEATLGTTLRVPTMDGAVGLKIPAGTPSGRTFRVKGRGVAKKSGRGDLMVTVEVAVPQKLDSEQRELLEKLAAASNADPRPSITAALNGGHRA